MWTRTKKMHARPVWKRHLMRVMRNTEDMDPPTDLEKHDAIQVLRDPDNAIVLGLWVEAHKILDESKENT